MLGRKTWIQLVTKLGIGAGALCVVGVLLAAIPNHRTPTVPLTTVESGQEPSVDHSQMAGMEMGTHDATVGENGAMLEMQHMHHGDTPHMHMTASRPGTAEDQKRAEEVVEQLRAGIEKYKDYHVALAEGYKIFLPNIRQEEYHFTNYTNGFLEAFEFEPTRPTSLLYKKTADGGFELVGAMYTMPRHATEDQLNERVPLSVATWHQHTNLCVPQKTPGRKPDWTKFGLRGSIHTEEACKAAGGTFYPVVFGWMVHVYPFENGNAKIFAMHHAE